MKHWALSISMLFTLACSNPNIEKGNLNVIPRPYEIIVSATESQFVIDGSTAITFPEKNEKLKRTAHFLSSYIQEITGTTVNVDPNATGHVIELSLDSTLSNPEGYEMKITADKITLKASSEVGIFYGVQTIHKALPITQGNALAALPAATIKDYPRFKYRGFMIDVGRHPFSIAYLKEMIDLMALHNINYFHWHLTEDQGWRIEIKKYPKLTEIGSYRKETIIRAGSNDFDGIPVRGFYSQEEAREIVRYAADRFITVIPEIDLPGHMLAALASYPELGCTGGPYTVPTRFGVFADVLCGGNESTLQFAKDVLNEIMDIFPSEFIHIGGDECPKIRWEKCSTCQKKIHELGLKTTPHHSKENQLQTYFMSEIEKVINERGRNMLGWDEVLEGGLTANTTIMSWTGIQGAIESAKQGHNAIMCPISHLYFSNPGYNRLKGVSSVARVYNFEPIPEELSENEKQYIIGTQGCVWTEWTKDSIKMEWQILPRMAALSEIQWTQPEKKDFDHFLGRLRHQIDLYTLKGFHYKEDINDVVIDINPIHENGNAHVSFTTFDQAEVHFTLDGSEPTKISPLYTETFTVDSTATIKAVAFRNGKQSNITAETIRYNLATMCPITTNSIPDPKYTYKGICLITDGMSGDGNYHSGRYLGFYATDLDVTIDLQKEQLISSVFVNTYLVPGDYIFGLTGLEVWISEDGKQFKSVTSKSIPVLKKGTSNNSSKREEITFDKIRTRYVRIIGKATPSLPAWHSGAGKKTFLFIDEIGVN